MAFYAFVCAHYTAKCARGINDNDTEEMGETKKTDRCRKLLNKQLSYIFTHTRTQTRTHTLGQIA